LDRLPPARRRHNRNRSKATDFSGKFLSAAAPASAAGNSGKYAAHTGIHSLERQSEAKLLVFDPAGPPLAAHAANHLCCCLRCNRLDDFEIGSAAGKYAARSAVAFTSRFDFCGRINKTKMP
jgi:hypothetical protein